MPTVTLNWHNYDITLIICDFLMTFVYLRRTEVQPAETLLFYFRKGKQILRAFPFTFPIGYPDAISEIEMHERMQELTHKYTLPVCHRPRSITAWECKLRLRPNTRGKWRSAITTSAWIRAAAVGSKGGYGQITGRIFREASPQKQLRTITHRPRWRIWGTSFFKTQSHLRMEQYWFSASPSRKLLSQSCCLSYKLHRKQWNQMSTR